MPAHEEAQIAQLRSAFRAKRFVIDRLRRKLHEEHVARSLSESTLSCISRHWAQLESALEDLQKQIAAEGAAPEVEKKGSKSVFALAIQEINSALNADVTYRSNRTVRSTIFSTSRSRSRTTTMMMMKSAKGEAIAYVGALAESVT